MAASHPLFFALAVSLAPANSEIAVGAKAISALDRCD
jgi:hypothetical protein